MSEPSDTAVSAGADTFHSMTQLNDVEQRAHASLCCLTAAHDPALGLDRSVCLRDVVEAAKRFAVTHVVAQSLEREFTNREEGT